MKIFKNLLGLLIAGVFFNSLIIGQERKSDTQKVKRIVMIANKNSVFRPAINADEIKDIYLGNEKFKNKVKILPVNRKDKKIFDEFVTRFLEMTPTSYKNHLVKTVFAGGWSAPKVMEKAEEVIKFVSENAGGMGYVWNTELSGNGGDIKIINIKK